MPRQYNESSPGRRRDEFQWEQELRREDRRISCYFRELPLCLDLPGEDEMIFENMQASPGLIPAGANPGHWRLWDAPDFDHAGEDEPERELFRFHSGGNDWLDRLDRMQVEWNTLAARSTEDAMTQIFLAVSCAFGKMYVHFSDFEDTVASELRPLKLCLGKRAIEDINELCNMLHAAAQFLPDLAGKMDVFVEDLLMARDFLTARCAEIRRQQDSI